MSFLLFLRPGSFRFLDAFTLAFFSVGMYYWSASPLC
ncbi:unnamed protein product [Amoebophrya sp. A25]|nr:unnamed protein product [Amoebophrya sp. A25]|eukprot:GSA25T00026293001.1